MKQNKTSTDPKYHNLIEKDVSAKDDSKMIKQHENTFHLDILDKSENSTAPILSEEVADDLAFLDEIESDIKRRPPAKIDYNSID